MTAELLIAGVCSLILALGHTLIGLRWVLPSLAEAALPRTPFGPPSLTVGMVRFTWQMFSVILPGFGILFLILAGTDANPMTLILRWGSAIWLAATAISLWNSRYRLRVLVRFPIPLFTVLIAAMCWIAST